jgi:hypothetical protein
MTTQSNPKSQDAVQSTDIARRRMLLTSLGKGSAVVAAAAVPMQSLADIGALALTADGKRCTISGNMSAAHSTGNPTAICTGKKYTYYQTLANWPTYNAQAAQNTPKTNIIDGSLTFNETTPFRSLFGGGPTDSLLTCLATDNNRAHWTAALLNGITGASTNFPYSAEQVIGLYRAGGDKKAQALAFFKNFMETVTQ